jgi:RNA polymerase sigma-70 factor (ECF subfamily)
MLIYLSMIESDGDRSKFEIIYREYRDLMLYIANRILGDTRDSEDIVHQAFLKIIGVLEKIEEPKCHKTRSLCVTIVERAAIDLYRRRQREKTVSLDEEFVNIPDTAQIDAAAGCADLAAAIDSLPTRYREVLLLRYDNGFSNREIAGLLSMSEVNVRKTIQRAKERLGRMLEEGGAQRHADHR